MSSDSFYASALFGWLAQCDPESAHDATFAALRPLFAHPNWMTRTLAQASEVTDPRWPVQAFGLRFAHPLGLAAGLDKHATALALWPTLGFGFVETGTVTPLPQPGNPRPRLFRAVARAAVVNRMGFNSLGSQAVAARMPARGSCGVPLGVNVGKNKDTPNDLAGRDYGAAIVQLREHADYLVINVSSPNTPALRELQSPQFLAALVRTAVTAAQGLPVLVKLAPDFAPDELEAVAVAAVDAGASGIIACNTTLSRPDPAHPAWSEAGGLSGAPLRALALATVHRIYAAVGKRVPIVGVGGVGTADDAYALVRAGATLVQVYTALIYQGPGLPRALVRGLADLLDRDGVRDWADLVGADHR